VSRDYTTSGGFRRLVRRTATTRPMTWLYLRVQQHTDHLLYRLTPGHATVSSLLSRLPVVMLTTTGARTGRPHTLPVLGVPDGDGLVVIASNCGRPRYPPWCHNLLAHLRATVTVDRTTLPVEARELSGPERDQCFQGRPRCTPVSSSTGSAPPTAGSRC
jgi:deazaflavin-dependent oxidoreductase (nitroreductase family)